MAQTEIHKYTVQERLCKMDIDLVDVTVSPDVSDAGSPAAGDALWLLTEIPNAVAVPGGSAILQSCCAIIAGGDDDGADTGAFEVVITNDSTPLTHGGGALATSDDVLAITSALAVMDGTCGFFSITNAFDAGVVALGDKKNIGMVCKAVAGSTSLYTWGIYQNAADYNEGSIVLRFGFVKD